MIVKSKDVKGYGDVTTYYNVNSDEFIQEKVKLKHPYFNKVLFYKDGKNVLSSLAMLVGLGLGLVLYITPIIFTMLGINGLLILLLNSIVVLTIMSLILFTNGKKKYEKIQA